MHEKDENRATASEPGRRCGLGRRARLGVGVVVLVGMGMVAGAFIASSVDASAHGGFFGHHHAGPPSLELQRKHMQRAAEWFADEVDASAEQRDQIDAIATELAEQIHPLRSAHRANKQALLSALAEPTVDRAALEQLRLAEIGLAESASVRFTEALADLAEVLTPEQRTAVIERLGH